MKPGLEGSPERLRIAVRHAGTLPSTRSARAEHGLHHARDRAAETREIRIGKIPPMDNSSGKKPSDRTCLSGSASSEGVDCVFEVGPVAAPTDDRVRSRPLTHVPTVRIVDECEAVAAAQIEDDHRVELDEAVG